VLSDELGDYEPEEDRTVLLRRLVRAMCPPSVAAKIMKQSEHTFAKKRAEVRKQDADEERAELAKDGIVWGGDANWQEP
jgi:hypothetical protein